MNRASLLFAVLATVACSAQETPIRLVRWSPNTDWSDTLTYNGQRYKTIGVKDKIFVGAALNDIRRFATIALVLVRNEGEQRLEVDPSFFTCKCEAQRDRMLRQGWPFGYQKNP